jgi:hypothetical protein
MIQYLEQYEASFNKGKKETVVGTYLLSVEN